MPRAKTAIVDTMKHPAYWPSYQAALAAEMTKVDNACTDADVDADEQHAKAMDGPSTSLYRTRPPTVDQAIRNARTVAEMAVLEFTDRGIT